MEGLHIYSYLLTKEGIHKAANSPHGPEENLGELLEAGVQHHLVWDAAGVEKLFLKLWSSAHYRWVAQVHWVASSKKVQCNGIIFGIISATARIETVQ